MAKRLKSLTSIASASWSYRPGQEFEAGAPGEVDEEEANRLVAAGVFEVVEAEKREPRRRRSKKETATARTASETATED